MSRYRILLISVLLFCAPRLFAQYVEGISAIAYDIPNRQIDTYSATELDYYTSFYYDAYVQGALYQSDDWSNPIRAGAAIGNPVADGYMQAPAVVGDDYILQSDHFVVAYFIVGYDIYGNAVFDDPYGYSFLGSNPPPSNQNQYSPPMTDYQLYIEYIYLGSTLVGITTYDETPVITSISPDVIPDGTTSTVTILGYNFGISPEVQVSDAPDMAVQVTSATDTQITVQVTPNGDDGPHDVEVISQGYGGTGFLSSPGATQSNSTPHTLRVKGNPCTAQIKTSTGQNMYDLAPPNYLSTTITLGLIPTKNAVCDNPSDVNWTVHASWATNPDTKNFPGRVKVKGEKDLASFTSKLGQNHDYFVPSGIGGKLTFKASFSANNKSQSLSAIVYVDGPAVDRIPSSMLNATAQSDYQFIEPSGTGNIFTGIMWNESKYYQFVWYRSYGVPGCWPLQEPNTCGYRGGLSQVQWDMTSAWDWTVNIGSGVVFFGEKLDKARSYESRMYGKYPHLPQLSIADTERDGILAYGPYLEAGYYWVPNAAKNAWIPNPNNPNGLKYVNDAEENAGIH